MVWRMSSGPVGASRLQAKTVKETMRWSIRRGNRACKMLPSVLQYQAFYRLALFVMSMHMVSSNSTTSQCPPYVALRLFHTVR